jgi:MFS family permease
MGAWFSASAVVPALTEAWSLDDSGRAWLTMTVQIGFVAGAFGSALLNLTDRLPARRLFAISAVLATLVTALIPAAADGLGPALPLRFLTGFFLAGVYPVGMKILFLEPRIGWVWAFASLAVGPVVGIWAMLSLRRSPAASRLAGGKG